jgi:RNA polymerase-binding transcription factor DksA
MPARLRRTRQDVPTANRRRPAARRAEINKIRRAIALPAQLVQALRAHRAGQLQERMIAGSVWHDGDYVWCQVTGRPIDAHAD